MFTYKPLDPEVDSLRVLVLLPPSPSAGGEIECELQNKTFSSKPVFEAVSYTWGTQPAPKTIKIGGKPFPVRENLYNALLHLRVKKRRVLWVDAICINQDDIPERNAQVRLMAFIYTRAQRVLVWLGLSPRPVENDYFSDGHWYAMSHSPYWSRLWVIQEMVLPNEVLFYLGRYSFGWEKVSSTMNPDWKALEGRGDVVKRMREERHTSTLRLENLIRVFQNAKCSEKRDKIYGFLGLTHDGSDQAITVDYNISFAQLYAQVLEFHQKPSTPSDTLSTKDLGCSAAKLIQFSQLLQRVLGASVSEEVRTTKDPNWSKSFYTATGSLSGEILRLGPTHAEVISSVRADRLWKQAIAQTYRTAGDLQYVRKANDAFTDAILGWDQKQLERIQGVRSKTSYAYRRGGTDADIPPSIASEKENGTLDASEPRLFLGSQNLIGVGPPEARIGDSICTFAACDVAVIVRKIEHEAKDCYFIVGRANVYRERYLNPDGEEEVEDVVERDVSRLAVDEEDAIPDDGSLQSKIYLRLDLQTLQQLTF